MGETLKTQDVLIDTIDTKVCSLLPCMSSSLYVCVLRAVQSLEGLCESNLARVSALTMTSCPHEPPSAAATSFRHAHLSVHADGQCDKRAQDKQYEAERVGDIGELIVWAHAIHL